LPSSSRPFGTGFVFACHPQLKLRAIVGRRSATKTFQKNTFACIILKGNSDMVLANIKFGRSGKQSRRELEELVETYLAHLLRQGQLCTEFFFAWTDGVLNACVHIPSPNAHALRHHSSYGKKSLAEVKNLDKIPNGNCWKAAKANGLQPGAEHRFFICSRTRSMMNRHSAEVTTENRSLHICFQSHVWKIFILGSAVTKSTTMSGLALELWSFRPTDNWQTPTVNFQKMGAICAGKLKRQRIFRRIIF
jgi:hypothetical protein